MENTTTTPVIVVTEHKMPSLAELTEDYELAFKNDQFNLCMNQPPPAKWIKVHPYVKGHNYLPIDKVEYLLRKIFKAYSIKITGQGTAFNGVWVTVRVTATNPTTNMVIEHDGIGAIQLQTKKDSSPADLANINNGALSMAFPLAKTLAIKDACDHFGKIFGSDLNRKDSEPFRPDNTLRDRINELKEVANGH